MGFALKIKKKNFTFTSKVEQKSKCFYNKGIIVRIHVWLDVITIEWNWYLRLAVQNCELTFLFKQIYSHLKDVVDKIEWMTSCCMHQTRSWFRISLEIECQKEPFMDKLKYVVSRSNGSMTTQNICCHTFNCLFHTSYRLLQVPSKFTGTGMGQIFQKFHQISKRMNQKPKY